METNPTPFHLFGKRILVLGATGALGSEVARVCARMGAHVVVSGRNRERLEALLAELEGTGHTAEVFDLSNLADIPIWMGHIAQESGRLSGVVHSAGLHELKPVRMVKPDKCADLLAANVTSALMVAKGLRQNTVRAESSSLVLISSTAGVVGSPSLSVYSASKGALLSMARSLAIELAGERMRVNCVAPAVVRGGIGTELEKTLGSDYFAKLEAQHPLGLGTAQDVACAAVYLLSDAARWITGTTLVLDGGNTAQ